MQVHKPRKPITGSTGGLRVRDPLSTLQRMEDMKSLGLLSGVVLVCLSARVGVASDVQWLGSIDQAKQVAAQTNRLVLVHFWSSSCMPCSKLEQEVYNIPGVGQQIGAAFVPVKVNVDEFPAVRQQYNIEFVPTDVVLTADGRVVAHRSCPLNRFEYIAGLTQVAASYQTQLAGAYANLNQHAAGLTTAATQAKGAVTQVGASIQQAANTATNVGDRYADYFAQRAGVAGAPSNARPGSAGPAAGATLPGPPGAAPPPTAAVAGPPPATVQAAVAPPTFGPPSPGPAKTDFAGSAGPPKGVTAQAGFQTGITPPATQPESSLAPPVQPNTPPAVKPPAAEPPTPGPASPPATPPATPPSTSQPPLALDGTCPVELVENERWVNGDRRWGANHRGKVYLFAGKEQQSKFLREPDRYSPALSGNDPVLVLDQGQWVPGRREHGLFYDKRVFLFSSEESLAKFYREPLRYAEGIHTMESAAASQR
jgi:YHS domain-containing protein